MKLSALNRAVKKDLKEKLFHRRRLAEPRYYRTVCRSGREIYVAYDTKVLESLLNSDREIELSDLGDKYYPVPDDTDKALKLNDNDIAKNRELLVSICQHVANGNYNSHIIERLRKIAEIENLHDAESLLADVPPRESIGPIESWCMAAIDLYIVTCQYLYDARARILKAGRE